MRVCAIGNTYSCALDEWMDFARGRPGSLIHSTGLIWSTANLQLRARLLFVGSRRFLRVLSLALMICFAQCAASATASSDSLTHIIFSSRTRLSHRGLEPLLINATRLYIIELCRSGGAAGWGGGLGGAARPRRLSAASRIARRRSLFPLRWVFAFLYF